MRRSGYLLLVTVVLGLLVGAPDSACQRQQSGREALPTLTKATTTLTSIRDIRRFGSPTLLAASMLNSRLCLRFLSKRATWLK